MITREQYEALVSNAFVQYDRYKVMYPMEAHIVFVVSPSVMSAMQVYGERNTESLFTVYHEPRNMTLLVKLRGADVLLVQGCGDETLFLPAFAWSNNTREICLNSGSAPLDGDLLIDDGSLYVYGKEQNCYSETGYTVQTSIGFETMCRENDAPAARSMPVKRRKAKVEQELNPGDTKAIDDYLNSFAPKQILCEA